MSKPKVLVINGPNLNLLGIRELEVYGRVSYKELCQKIEEFAQECELECEIWQENSEGEIINKLHETQKEEACLVILNPGAYTHYSYAIADAIRAINTPVIEVHLSNIYSREEFRAKSVIAPACVGQISGFGANSYLMALRFGRETSC